MYDSEEIFIDNKSNCVSRSDKQIDDISVADAMTVMMKRKYFT